MPLPTGSRVRFSVDVPEFDYLSEGEGEVVGQYANYGGRRGVIVRDGEGQERQIDMHWIVDPKTGMRKRGYKNGQEEDVVEDRPPPQRKRNTKPRAKRVPPEEPESKALPGPGTRVRIITRNPDDKKRPIIVEGVVEEEDRQPRDYDDHQAVNIRTTNPKIGVRTHRPSPEEKIEELEYKALYKLLNNQTKHITVLAKMLGKLVDFKMARPYRGPDGEPVYYPEGELALTADEEKWHQQEDPQGPSPFQPGKSPPNMYRKQDGKIQVGEKAHRFINLATGQPLVPFDDPEAEFALTADQEKWVNEASNNYPAPVSAIHARRMLIRRPGANGSPDVYVLGD